MLQKRLTDRSRNCATAIRRELMMIASGEDSSGEVRGGRGGRRVKKLEKGMRADFPL